MAATDRVQLLKLESAALGGDAADEKPFPSPISPQEDGIETAGVFLQDATNRDEAVEVSRSGDDMTFKDVNNATGLTLSQLAAGGGGATPQWQHVDTQIVSGDVASVTFSSLDGDTDLFYHIDFYWIANLAAVIELECKPNNITPGTSEYSHRYGFAAGLTSAPVTDFAFNGSSKLVVAELHGWSSGGQLNGSIFIPAYRETSKPRIIRSQWAGERTVSAIVRASIWGGHQAYWNDDTSNITSIVLDAGTTGAIAAGSRFSLSKGKFS